MNPEVEAEIRANFLKASSIPTKHAAQEVRPNPAPLDVSRDTPT
jgi:hypothetical protein